MAEGADRAHLEAVLAGHDETERQIAKRNPVVSDATLGAQAEG
jgi:hypothetical protein